MKVQSQLWVFFVGHFPSLIKTGSHLVQLCRLANEFQEASASPPHPPSHWVIGVTTLAFYLRMLRKNMNSIFCLSSRRVSNQCLPIPEPENNVNKTPRGRHLRSCSSKSIILECVD